MTQSVEQPPSICLINVATPDGNKDYVALVSATSAFDKGLIPEAILGILKRPLNAGEGISPDNFIANSVFRKFLAEVIAKHGPDDPGLQAEAAQIGRGYVVVVDRRTPTPEGPVPLQDIIGAFNVEDGKVLPESYIASPNHSVLTEDGFFQLNPMLDERLQQELAARQTN